MKLHHSTPILLALALISCDQVKKIVDETKVSIEAKMAEKVAEVVPTEKPVDPELAKLIDQTGEGYIFRKDLPFPSHLEVKTTRKQVLASRETETSAIETKKTTVKGTETQITHCERSGEQVRYTLIEHTFMEPITEKTDTSKVVAKVLTPPSKPSVFIKTDSAWKPTGGDFRTASLAQTISPVFDQLLIDHCLISRPLWFGQKRIKIGDSLPVAGNTLPMLISGKARGTLTLTLEAVENVHGHPCGLFSVTGDYNRSQRPDFEATLTDEEVTIRAGKIWLSLIHPIILKEELETIQSYKSGGQGGLFKQGQGSVNISTTREWIKKS